MVEPRQLTTTLRHLRTLEGFGSRMTVHARISSAEAVASVCAEENLGAVYTMPPARSSAIRFATAESVVRQHAARVGSVDGVLLDAQRYSSNRRVPGTRPHDLTWTAHQHRLGLSWALTDSGYIGEGDMAALHNTLAEGSRHYGRTLVALPLHNSWLGHRADQLRKAIDTAGLPVALMVEHRDDPFGVRRTVEGLLEVLDSSVPVGLLRSDISAVGALAHGGVVGAVGTTTGLRHIFPSSDRPSPRPVAKPAAVVPQALLYKQLDRIAEAVRADGDQTRWICMCSHCMGRTLDWIITAEDAFLHSLSALALLTHQVLSSSDPRTTWREKCRVAQFVNLDIDTSIGLDWQSPAFLGHWINE
jgi:hypothetical protein